MAALIVEKAKQQCQVQQKEQDFFQHSRLYCQNMEKFYLVTYNTKESKKKMSGTCCDVVVLKFA